MKFLHHPTFQLLFSGIVGLCGVAYVLGDEAANDKLGNPLRVVEGSSGDKSSKNNQVIRGTATEPSSQGGGIDFIIIDPATGNAAGPKTSNTSPATSPSKPTANKAQSDKRPIISPEIHSEYERLHEGAGKKTSDQSPNKDVIKQQSPTIVFGEDTDNPDFTVAHESTQEASDVEDAIEPLELMDSIVAVDEIAELQEAPTGDESQEAINGAVVSIDGDNENESSTSKTAESAPAKDNPTSAESASRPTMRRPKPILIDPIDINRNSPIKVPSPSKEPISTSKVNNDNQSPLKAPSRQLKSYSDPAVQLRAQRTTAALLYYLQNPESTTARSPWAVMHAILPYGMDAELVSPNGQRVNAISWTSANRLCKTQTLFTPVGRAFRPNVGGGVQGHEGQYLAILAQSGVPSSDPITVNQNQFTVANLVQYEMATCKAKTELTFKLIGLSYYLGTKQSWRTKDRQVWNVERLLGEELAQPVNGAACGGAHRLMGIHIAVKQRKDEGMPINGKFAAAAKYIEDYKEYAWSLQNPDGSFSTNWFESRGMENNDERKVQTTGHILEWLVYCSTPEQLNSRRTAAAIDFLLSKIYDKREYKWPIGPRGHALRAIALYREKCLELEPLTMANASMASQQIAPARNR